MTTMKTCFVICPIGSYGSAIRKRSDQLLKYVIDPVCSDLNYKCVRADLIQESGIITHQIIENIIDSDIVIADLTGHNPNVFYELAIRHATKKPFIHTIQEGEQIPFDISSNRVIFIDINDLDSVFSAKNVMKTQIEHIEKNSESISNPITQSLDLTKLRESGTPSDKALSMVMEELSNLREEINRLRQIEDFIINKNISRPQKSLSLEEITRFIDSEKTPLNEQQKKIIDSFINNSFKEAVAELKISQRKNPRKE